MKQIRILFDFLSLLAFLFGIYYIYLEAGTITAFFMLLIFIRQMAQDKMILLQKQSLDLTDKLILSLADRIKIAKDKSEK